MTIPKAVPVAEVNRSLPAVGGARRLSCCPIAFNAGEGGFYVRDQVRFTFFSYDGTLLRTVPNPPTSVGYQGFQIRVGAILDDGSFLGDPMIPASVRLGLWGDDAIDSLAEHSKRDSGGIL